MSRLDEKWALGKVWDSLVETARTIETLNKTQDTIPEEVFEELRDKFWGVINYQVQVVFCLNDVEDFDLIDIVEDILNKGELGLDENLQKYGIIQDSEILKFERARLHKEEIERPNFVKRIFELSQKGMTDSRREIYVECEKFGRDKLTKQILDLIEDVTQGTKPWSEFQKEVALVLSPHLESIVNETQTV